MWHNILTAIDRNKLQSCTITWFIVLTSKSQRITYILVDLSPKSALKTQSANNNMITDSKNNASNYSFCIINQFNYMLLSLSVYVISVCPSLNQASLVSVISHWSPGNLLQFIVLMTQQHHIMLLKTHTLEGSFSPNGFTRINQCNETSSNL